MNSRTPTIARLAGVAAALCASVIVTLPTSAASFASIRSDSDSDAAVFLKHAVEHPDGTVTLPIHRGTSHGKTVWYLLTDASNEDFADEHGINLARPLANARGTAAVQKVSIKDGVIDFPATVDFSPVRKVVPSATGFPPLVAQPGAVGESNYSPLIELPNGTIANAPHIANDSGQGDKVLALDTNKRTVLYGETNGFKDGKQAHYISTDSSSPVAAAIEGVTYAPALNALLALPANTPPDSSLVAFINGQTGANNPQLSLIHI